LAAVAELLVDPEVSRVKFEREISRYRDNEREYRQRGWLLLKAQFPEVEVAFVASAIWPQPLIFAVRVDFSNYDLWAPSVRFIDPFDAHALTLAEVAKKKIALVQVQPGVIPGIPNFSSLVQGEHENDLAFICLPGIREFHDHPAHSGDPWLTHRKDGIGSLHNILDKLHAYGIANVRGVQVAVAITDFQRVLF
jgi:hypothetical protein